MTNRFFGRWLWLVFTFLGTSSCGRENSEDLVLSEQNTAQPPPQADAEVVIDRIYFLPAVIKIKVGQAIRWVNRSIYQHSVTSESFDSGPIDPGQAFTLSFHSAGEFDYLSVPHADIPIKGKVIVTY